MNRYTLSPAGDHFLKVREAEGGRPRLTAYLDSKGIPTIGWGHIDGVRLGMTCSIEQAQAWFDEDTAWAVNAVNTLVRVPLAPAQADALISLVFNIGAGAFKTSTLLRKLNNGDFAGAAEQFLVWNKIRVGQSFQISTGLSNRRKLEHAMFLSAPKLGEAPMPDAIDAVAVAAGAATGQIWLPAAVSALRALWPELKPVADSLTGKSEVAQRNMKAAGAVLDAVMTATGTTTIPAAVEAVHADPVAASTARSAAADVLADWGYLDTSGVSEARKAASMDSTHILGNLTFNQLLALLMVTICGLGGGWVLWDPIGHFGDQIRAMVITAMFIGGWTGIQTFYFGSSQASRHKDDVIAAQAGK